MKHLFRHLVLLAALAFAPALHAAIEKDLGQGLFYIRVTDPENDKQAVVETLMQKSAVVVDLRSVAADREFANALRSAIAKTGQAKSLRMFLVNTTTGGPLRAIFNDERLSSLITIGPRSLAVRADIEISISEEDDKKAHAALANGTPLEKLLTDTREKRRYDEAKLVQDHANGVTSEAELPDGADDATDSEALPSDNKKAPATEKKPESAPLLDLVLERAMQLHRSMVALKRL